MIVVSTISKHQQYHGDDYSVKHMICDFKEYSGGTPKATVGKKLSTDC